MLRKLSTPDIRLLQVFVTVVESGGFSAAQISLNVGQSTISTQMADLEARLGMRLCNRGRAGFALTQDGRAVYEAAKGLFRSIDQFTAQVGGRRGGLVGELRIAFGDALVGNRDFRLDEVIARLRAKAPELHFDLSIANPLDLEQGVLEERFHVGIHTFPSHAPGLRYEPLFGEEQTLYCGAKHPFFAKPAKALDRETIEAADYVRRAYYGGTLHTGAFRPAKVTASADSMEAIVLLILSGRYIGHLPTKWAQGWLRRGLLRALMPRTFSYRSQFEVVVRTGSESGNLIEAFMAELLAVYGRRAGQCL